MIIPSNGRIVWFTPGVGFAGVWADKDAPLAAMVCHVWSPRMVNLVVFDSNGTPWPVTSVDLLQGDESASELQSMRACGRYAEWMPYQKGQAAKTEELERAVKEINP